MLVSKIDRIYSSSQERGERISVEDTHVKFHECFKWSMRRRRAVLGEGNTRVLLEQDGWCENTVVTFLFEGFVFKLRTDYFFDFPQLETTDPFNGADPEKWIWQLQASREWFVDPAGYDTWQQAMKEASEKASKAGKAVESCWKALGFMGAAIYAAADLLDSDLGGQKGTRAVEALGGYPTDPQIVELDRKFRAANDELERLREMIRDLWANRPPSLGLPAGYVEEIFDISRYLTPGDN